jgi:deoxyribonuclease-1
MAWDRSYPVTDWELERNNRISRISGRSNPYVTGHKTWSMGYRPQLAINTNVNPAADSRPAVEPEGNLMIRGNRRSRIYHLPAGCPSYSRISPNNVETFVSESAAIDAGYRKAGNCR